MRKPRKKRVRKPLHPSRQKPMTPEELLEYGYLFFSGRRKTGIPAEEAVSEFVSAGYLAAATAQDTRSIRSYQIRAGEWAVLEFRRYHARRLAREQIYRQYRAGFPVP